MSFSSLNSDSPDYFSNDNAKLFDVIEKGDLNGFYKLLHDGSDINCRNRFGDTPLHFAAHYGHEVLTKVLLVLKADPNVKNIYGDTPLHNAISEGHSELVSSFLEFEHVDLDVRNENGDGLLHIACGSETFEESILLEILKKEVCDINAVNDFGDTPLHVASLKGFNEVVKILVQHGAEVNVKNKKGDTPLLLCAGYARCDLVRFLILKGANINITNEQGNNALHEAIKLTYEISDLKDIMCTLFVAGINLFSRNAEGYTPLELAEDLLEPGTFHYFLKYYNDMLAKAGGGVLMRVVS